MTEWDAAEYSRRSSLQEAMAQEVLALLDLNGPERILDVGCGDGKITAEIAIRVPPASVVGVDPSRDMISFAQSHFSPATRPNAINKMIKQRRRQILPANLRHAIARRRSHGRCSLEQPRLQSRLSRSRAARPR